MQRACETGWASLAGEAEFVRWKHGDPASSGSDEIDGPREAVDRDASARADCENVEAESSARRVFVGGYIDQRVTHLDHALMERHWQQRRMDKCEVVVKRVHEGEEMETCVRALPIGQVLGFDIDPVRRHDRR